MFTKGFKKDFEEEDIYKVLKSCKSKTCGNSAERQWYKTPSLIKLLLYQFGLQYFFITLIEIAWTEAQRYVGHLLQ